MLTTVKHRNILLACALRQPRHDAPMSNTPTLNFFGTDGIRGKAGLSPMTPDLLLSFAQAIAAELPRGAHRPIIVIGKDTRLSGYMVEPALVSGFIAQGCDVLLVGPIPTPGIAHLVQSLRADLGVMISASHNPFEDNGVKLFGADGYKLTYDVQAKIEARVEKRDWPTGITGAQLGRARRIDDAPGRYIESLKATFPRGLRLDGLKVVVDCANGAAYKIAPTVLWELGAEVVPLAVEPNGQNINKNCGSTAPAALQQAVVVHQAHLGIALDGDADRVILVDDTGALVDGDFILAAIARLWQEEEREVGGEIVGTVMCNTGLEKYIASLGLTFHRTAVGDHHVIDRLRATGAKIGGEPSGHIILPDYSTTGDGILAALQVLALLKKAGQPAHKVLRVFTPYPSKLINVRVADVNAALASPAALAAQQAATTALAGRGRLLVRRSGTEPLVRVYVEAETAALVDEIIAPVAAAFS